MVLILSFPIVTHYRQRLRFTGTSCEDGTSWWVFGLGGSGLIYPAVRYDREEVFITKY